jgi:hypothetical protein
VWREVADHPDDLVPAVEHQVPLTRFAAAPLSTLSHKGRGEKRPLALAPPARFNGAGETMTKRISFFRFPAIMSALVLVMAALGVSPARADRCDDLAKDLAGQITGLKIGKTVAGVIYLEHPAVTQASLGCQSRNRSNDVFASTDKKKPTEAYYDFIGTAAALVFTIPKPDAVRGAKRCVSRTNIVRGYNIDSRYRRLDIHCTVAKTGVRITMSREKGV